VPEESQLIVVANRLPVRRISEKDRQHWVTSPSGLVSALWPVMSGDQRACLIGWAGSTGASPSPFEHEGLRLHPVSLSRADLQLYYEGFSNGTLWPLYHDVIAQPEYHRMWWEAYRSVNRRFADAVIEVAEPNVTRLALEVLVNTRRSRLSSPPTSLTRRRDSERRAGGIGSSSERRLSTPHST
jgi:trehalose 6-phosphate synthase